MTVERKAIAESLLGSTLDAEGFGRCPGESLHTSRTGRRDFRVSLDGAPTGSCFHSHCAGAVEDFNRDLRRRIGAAERPDAPAPVMLGEAVAPPPSPIRTPKRPPYDAEKLAAFAACCPVSISFDWLAERSPVPIPAADKQDGRMAADFLWSLHRPGERLLIFTRQFSQGDFLFDPTRGGFRLAAEPTVKAVPSPLPDGGPEGVWWLIQPVTGQWAANINNRDGAGNVKLGRRHSACVTRWPHLLLESDEAPADLWLRALVQLPLPIVAAYTSGGRSVHALVRVDAGSKAEWDAIRDELLPIVCPLGADPAAMSAVRLSRLPGCQRFGKRDKDGKMERYPSPRLQRLLWLNPQAGAVPILDTVRR